MHLENKHAQNMSISQWSSEALTVSATLSSTPLRIKPLSFVLTPGSKFSPYLEAISRTSPTSFTILARAFFSLCGHEGDRRSQQALRTLAGRSPTEEPHGRRKKEETVRRGREGETDTATLLDVSFLSACPNKGARTRPPLHCTTAQLQSASPSLLFILPLLTDTRETDADPRKK
ncbi:unnamed protein product [Pleuronectes platessa]|uniref:Uncharacterized protein n=1 Tax=Pleuronectes platessa TaxID=8262 RepID=A0A9N7Y8C7_PLEPL|nr:unnamed protein product [Pleuronectes platessa]